MCLSTFTVLKLIWVSFTLRRTQVTWSGVNRTKGKLLTTSKFTQGKFEICFNIASFGLTSRTLSETEC